MSVAGGVASVVASGVVGSASVGKSRTAGVSVGRSAGSRVNSVVIAVTARTSGVRSVPVGVGNVKSVRSAVGVVMSMVTCVTIAETSVRGPLMVVKSTLGLVGSMLRISVEALGRLASMLMCLKMVFAPGSVVRGLGSVTWPIMLVTPSGVAGLLSGLSTVTPTRFATVTSTNGCVPVRGLSTVTPARPGTVA